MEKHWRRAQILEAQFWKKQKEQILTARYQEEIKERAMRVEKWLNQIKPIEARFNILEVGGGGKQLTDYFKTGSRYSIDPLACFYQSEFSSMFSPEVQRVQARAEEIPFRDNYFDLIISRNALDHLESPQQFLAESKRVLKEDGLCYLGVNTFSGPLYLFRRIKKSGEHPFVFNRARVEKLITDSGFEIIDSKFDSPDNMREFNELVFESSLRNFLQKLILFLHSYHFYEAILKK